MELPQSLSQAGDWITTFFNFKLFEINQTAITPASILVFILVILAFFIISRILNRGVLRRVLDRLNMERGMQFTLIRINHYIIMIIGAVIAFQIVGFNLGGLAVIFGFLSVGIGFGLQNITSNFISGLILLFERPISVGDRVTVGDTEGDVTAINMRSTTVRSLNNITIIVPNSEFIANNVINWSHGDPKIRLDIPVGVSYSSDVDLVIKALHEVAQEHSAIMADPKPEVLLKNFGDSSWDMELRVWVGQAKGYYRVRSEINVAIVRKFRQYDIEIPFPQRDLHVRSPLPVPLSTIAQPTA
jgi:small-conductance mechanosensitive channel